MYCCRFVGDDIWRACRTGRGGGERCLDGAFSWLREGRRVGMGPVLDHPKTILPVLARIEIMVLYLYQHND